MSNTAINRENVQQILDRNTANRKEAILEAQARKLRLHINANHTAKLAKLFPPEQPERRQEEAKAKAEHLKRKQEKRAERAAEAAYCTDWYGFMLRLFTPMLIAAATIGLCNTGILPIGLAIPCAIVACLVSIQVFASRFIPHECNAEKPLQINQ